MEDSKKIRKGDKIIVNQMIRLTSTGINNIPVGEYEVKMRGVGFVKFFNQKLGSHSLSLSYFTRQCNEGVITVTPKSN